MSQALPPSEGQKYHVHLTSFNFPTHFPYVKCLALAAPSLVSYSWKPNYDGHLAVPILMYPVCFISLYFTTAFAISFRSISPTLLHAHRTAFKHTVRLAQIYGSHGWFRFVLALDGDYVENSVDSVL